MSILFSPLLIKNITLRNRIVVSPMCMYSSSDGFANDWHLVHLGSRAVGGAGLIISEATSVLPEGRITPGDLGIWKEEHVPYLERIVSFIHQQGSIAGIQLAHAGRKASHSRPWEGGKPLSEGSWKTFAPSPVPFTESHPAPAEMNKEDIAKVIQAFREGAKRAKKAGFKIIEIHAAHGYLINEFLSPLTNLRSDEYGGSFENRCRFLLEIVRIVRTVWSEDNPLFVRISATEWKEGGWDIKDSIELCKILKENGVDLIDCSSGGNQPKVHIPLRPGYQVDFAETIKRETGMFTGAVGMIKDARQAEEIIISQQADLVLLARGFLNDPYFPLHAARELKFQYKWPVQYERSLETFN